MTGRTCSIFSTVLKNVTRPSLHCEDVRQEIGKKFGRRCFSAVTFEAEIDPFEYTGNFEKVTLYVNSEEIWDFYEAKIALLPNSKLDRNYFVIIFDSCLRVDPN